MGQQHSTALTEKITISGPGVDTSHSFTVAAWVKLSSLTGEQTFLAQNGSGLPSMYLEYSPTFGGWTFALKKQNNGGTATTDYDYASSPTSKSAVGVWTHLAGVYDGSTGSVTLYVDGRPTSTSSSAHTTPWQGAGPLSIGGAGTANHTSAAISAVETYQSVLSANDVATVADSLDYSTYDEPGGIGQLAAATTHEDGNSYTVSVPGYNADGQATGATWTIPAAEGALAGTYTETYGFDPVTGQQNSVTYPAAGGLPTETVNAAWDHNGIPTTLTATGIGSGTTTYVGATSFNSTGQIKGRTLGASGVGQVTRSYTYNTQTQALDTLTATVGTSTNTPIQQDTYARNAVGQVTSLTDALSGQAQCFQYDSLARMTAAYTADGSACAQSSDTTALPKYSYQYDFDNIDNTKTATDVLNSANTKTFTYADPAHVHAPTSDGDGSSYAYDANGNMTTRTTPANGTQTLTWNDGQLTAASASTGSTTFIDGPSGRLLRHDPGGAAVLYIGGEQLALSGTTVTATRYYTAQDGATVAQRTPSALTWLLSDAQGSASLAVDSVTGNPTRQYYTPYGNQRGGNTLQPITDHAFLGHVEDYSTGLLQDGARYYDPASGHFISADPINSAGPDQLNAYAYAGNNPASSSDPSGLVNDGTDHMVENKGSGPSCPVGTHDNGNYGCDKNVTVIQLPFVPTSDQLADHDPLYDPYGDAANHMQAVSIFFNWWCVDNISGGRQPVGCGDMSDAFGWNKNLGQQLLAGTIIVAAAFAPLAVCELGGCAAAASCASNPICIGQFGTEAGLVITCMASGTCDGVPGDPPGVGVSICLGNSFDGETPVLMADGSAKPIKDVKVGDEVEAADPATGKKIGPRRVEKLWLNHDSGLTDVTVTDSYGQTSTLHTTAGHPFWDVTAGVWVTAGQLTVGDQLASSDGRHPRVSKVTAIEGTADRYNLTVDDLHTYYVVAGDTPLLVHNADCSLFGQYQAGLNAVKAIDRSGFADPNDERMVGLLVMDNGTSKELMSGGRNVFAGYTPPPGAAPGGWATHLEPQAAAALRANPGVQKAYLYISGDYVCDTCADTLGTMLPDGVQLTVVYTGSNGMPASKTFQGGWP